MIQTTVHKKSWKELTAVEFEWLARKSQFLYTTDGGNRYQLVVSYSLFNSMGRKLGTGELMESGDMVKFNNGLTVVPDRMFYDR